MAQPMELQDIWRAILRSRWLVTALTFSSTAAAVLVSFYLQPVYRAEVLIIPVGGEPAINRALGPLVEQFSGLAAAAGLTDSTVSQKDIAITMLRSKAFTREILQKYDLLKELFQEDWDAKKGDWRVPIDEAPTLADGVDRFARRVRSISEDSRTGVVTLAIEWRDPDLAAKWCNLLVDEVNEKLRQRMIKEAQSSINYLNAELEKTKVVEIKNAIFRLIEAQISEIMIANVRPEYAFRVMDPAIPPDPDDYVRPQRFLISGLGFIFGAAVGVFAALLRAGPRRRQEAAAAVSHP